MQSVQLATAAMGTRFELLLFGQDGPHLRAVGEEAVALIEGYHRLCSVHDRSSAISRVNATGRQVSLEVQADQKWVPIDGELADLLASCAQLHEQTQGWFDVCASRAHKDEGPGFELSGQRVRLCAQDARIDLGGIAKGWALDRVADMFKAEGIHSALLHGGTSSVLGIGTQPDGQPWKIGLENHAGPNISHEHEQDEQSAHGQRVWCVELNNAALGVSGMDGKDTSGRVVRPGHVVNPRTGKPVGDAAQPVVGAACVGPSCAHADAWSTALLASGGLLELPTGLSGAVFGGKTVGNSGSWRVVSGPEGVFDTARKR